MPTYLNDAGYRARSGKCCHPSSIRGMVQNLTYTGVLRCGDARSELMPELQIIPEQQFETAQRIRDSRSVRAAADAEHRTPLNIHGKSLLSGNAYCGHCGAKLELTSSRKWRKLPDGSLDDTLRIRYTCYGKLRKQTECTGQTGYTVHILDEIIDKAVRQIFSKMRGIPKEQIITKRYEKETAERKNHLQDLQTQRDKAEKDLLALKAEVLACIKGESALPRETLAEMIKMQEEKLKELETLCESASEELERKAELMDRVSKLYDELISYADLYPRELYQRGIQRKRVELIARDFNEYIANEPKVSFRNGRFYVTDGQHTIEGRILRNGGKDLPILCKVYTGLTMQQEALFFAEQNGHAAPLTAGIKLRAKVVGEDAPSKAFLAATNRVGLEFNYDSLQLSDYRISCVGTALKLYNTVGEKIYCEALRLIVAAWEGRPDSFRAAVLKGMMHFVELYHGEYSTERLIRTLRSVHPMEIYRTGMDNPAKLPGWKKYVFPIYTAYNGKSRKDALPMKF